jgi:hypothetical protein
VSHEQKAGQNNNMKIGNKSFDRVEQFTYLGTTSTNESSNQEEIKSRLKSVTAYHHSVQKLLFSNLLSENMKIRMYGTIIWPVVLYGCDTWFLTLTDEHRVRVFENRVLKKIFGPRRNEVTGEWRGLHEEEFYVLQA